jgi:drug/metabolite transporter (DMT)-like permease
MRLAMRLGPFILGVLVLSENITVTTLVGIALVLAGVAMTRRRESRDTSEPEVT